MSMLGITIFHQSRFCGIAKQDNIINACIIGGIIKPIASVIKLSLRITRIFVVNDCSLNCRS